MDEACIVCVWGGGEGMEGKESGSSYAGQGGKKMTEWCVYAKGGRRGEDSPVGLMLIVAVREKQEGLAT